MSFLAIHPFENGNGRLSRVPTTWLLLQASYAYVPYSSLEAIVEQNKASYYTALWQTQLTIYTSKQDWQPRVLFFLRCLHAQVKQLEKKRSTKKLCCQFCLSYHCKFLN